MDFKLELAHLQLTLRCNLRCPFCGQWGANGFANGNPNATAGEMSEGEWFNAVEQIVALSAESGGKPCFVLWGGEPLLHKGAGAILKHIKSLGCQAGIVTNGMLLEKHVGELADSASLVYVSLDGPGEVHDQIRNSPGLHKRIERGLAALPREGMEKIALSVITDANMDMLPETARYAGAIGFDRIIFQNLIFMLPDEAKRYDSWLKESLGIENSNSASWRHQELPGFSGKLPEAFAKMEKLRAAGEFPLKVEFHPLGINSGNVFSRMEGSLSLPGSPKHCLAPFRHINVGPDGALRFCIDFNELDLGSLRERPLKDILASKEAAKFQEGIVSGLNPACARCPWRHISCYEKFDISQIRPDISSFRPT